MGVVGMIIPWNFPLHIACRKGSAALAAGNTVVLKAPELAPLTSLELGRICLEAGMPPGVFNVVPGLGEVAGAALAEHPGVDKVAFTGSTVTGRTVMRAGAGTIKRVSLELGGKSPSIVFADADLDRAVIGSRVRHLPGAGRGLLGRLAGARRAQRCTTSSSPASPSGRGGSGSASHRGGRPSWAR